MAWNVTGQNLSMAEGDFGIALPIEISGTTFSANDEIYVVIKQSINGDAIIEKRFPNIQDNTVNLMLSESESARLPVGGYVYSVDWYQSGAFMCNVVPWASFKVVEKA